MLKITAVIRSTRAAIDLASIMVGIIVIGIISGVIAATVFAVIPFAQNKAAESILNSVATSESVFYGLSEPSKFATKEELIEYSADGKTRDSLIDNSSKYDVRSGFTSEGKECWAAAVRSDSGTFFYKTSNSASSKTAASFLAANQEVKKSCDVNLEQPTFVDVVANKCQAPKTTSNVFQTVSTDTDIDCGEPTDVYSTQNGTSVKVGSSKVKVVNDAESYTVTVTNAAENTWGVTPYTSEPSLSCVYWSEDYVAANPSSAHQYVTDISYYPNAKTTTSCAKETVGPFDPTSVTLHAVVLKTGVTNQIRTVWTLN